jgi:anti-sigma B factor antagonist
MSHRLDTDNSTSEPSEWLGAAYQVEDLQGCAVVVASGEIDVATSPGLSEALAVAQTTSGRVIVDLRRVTFLDSTGIGVMLAALRRSRERRGMCLVGPTPPVLRVLAITQLTAFLPIYDSTLEAVESFA